MDKKGTFKNVTQKYMVVLNRKKILFHINLQHDMLVKWRKLGCFQMLLQDNNMFFL